MHAYTHTLGQLNLWGCGGGEGYCCLASGAGKYPDLGEMKLALAPGAGKYPDLGEMMLALVSISYISGLVDIERHKIISS